MNSKTNQQIAREAVQKYKQKQALKRLQGIVKDVTAQLRFDLKSRGTGS